MIEHSDIATTRKLLEGLADEIQSHRSRICNAILLSTAIVAFPTLAASLYRSTSIGWQPIMAVHTVIAIVLWSITIFRKHIKYQLQAGFIVFMFLLVGLAGISRFGLAAAAVAFLIAAAPLATLLFDGRIGIAIMAVVFTGAALIGFVSTTGDFSYDFDIAAYVLSPTAWTTAIATWAFASIALTASVYVFNRELIESLGKSIEQQERLEQVVEKLDQSNEKLQIALDEIATLQGIIPICSYCHSIRDDQGAWNRLETYLSNHSEAQFSHGICPDCNTKISTDLSIASP